MTTTAPKTTDPLAALRDWGGAPEMSAFDAAMWLAEADPRMRTTVTGLMELDRAPDWERLVHGHQRLTQGVPRLRQRVVEPAMGLPQWVDDPDFLLENHLRRLRLPEPGTHRQLLDLTQQLAMTPFDRARPPWDTTVIEGLEGGRAAIILRLHHVLSDGLGINQLLAEGVSTQRESRELPVGRRVVGKAGAATVAGVAGQKLHDIPAQASGLLAALAQRLRKPPDLAAAWDYLASAGRVLANPPAEGSPILRRRSRNWRFDTLELPLAGLKDAARRAGATLNDVFLAGLAGGLGRYNEVMGAQVKQMPLAFPISLRTAEDTAGGNHFGGARYAAPVGEPDPAQRVAHVHAFVRRVRQEPGLDVMQRLSPWLVQLPAATLGALMVRTSSMIDAQVSNVPGPPVPVYVAGAQVTRQWGLGPVPGCAMMIVFTSYAGTCSVGISTDRAAVIEPELLVDCLRQGLEEVAALQMPEVEPLPVKKKRTTARSTSSTSAAKVARRKQ